MFLFVENRMEILNGQPFTTRDHIDSREYKGPYIGLKGGFWWHPSAGENVVRLTVTADQGSLGEFLWGDVNRSFLKDARISLVNL